jgi:hypothetical protein
LLARPRIHHHGKNLVEEGSRLPLRGDSKRLAEWKLPFRARAALATTIDDCSWCRESISDSRRRGAPGGRVVFDMVTKPSSVPVALGVIALGIALGAAVVLRGSLRAVRQPSAISAS